MIGNRKHLSLKGLFNSIKTGAGWGLVLVLGWSQVGCFRLEMQIEDIQNLSAQTSGGNPPQDQVISIGSLKLRSDYYAATNFSGPPIQQTISIFEESPQVKGVFEIKNIVDLNGLSTITLTNSKNGNFQVLRQSSDLESSMLRISIQDDKKNTSDVLITVRWIRSPYTWRGTVSKDPMDGRNWCGSIDPITSQCTMAQNFSPLPDLELSRTQFIFDSNCLNCDVEQASDLKIGPISISENFSGQFQLLAGQQFKVLGAWRQFGGTVQVSPSSLSTSLFQVNDGISLRGKARWNVLSQNFSKFLINVSTPVTDSSLSVVDIEADTKFTMPTDFSILSTRVGQMFDSSIQLLHRVDQPALQFQNLEASSLSQDLHFSSLQCDSNMQNCVKDEFVAVQNNFHLLQGGFSGDISVEGNVFNESLDFKGNGKLAFVGNRNQTFGSVPSAQWPEILVQKSSSSRLDPESTTSDILVKGFHFYGGQMTFPSSISFNPAITSLSPFLFEIKKKNVSDPDPVILNTPAQSYSLHFMPDNSGCDKLGGASPQILMASQLPLSLGTLTFNATTIPSSPCKGKDVHFAWTGPDFPDIQTNSLFLISGVFDIPAVEVHNQVLVINISSKDLIYGGAGYIQLSETSTGFFSTVQVTTISGGEDFQIPSILASTSTGIIFSALEMKIESLLVTDGVPFVKFQSPNVGTNVNVKIQPTHATLPGMLPYFNMTYPYLFKLPSASTITGLDILTVQPRIRDPSCLLFPRGQISLTNLSIGSFQSLPTVVECAPSSPPPPAPAPFELHVAAYNTSIADNLPATPVTMTSSTSVHTGPSLTVKGVSIGLGSFRGGTITNATMPH